jgi:hypothetical protein
LSEKLAQFPSKSALVNMREILSVPLLPSANTSDKRHPPLAEKGVDRNLAELIPPMAATDRDLRMKGPALRGLSGVAEVTDLWQKRERRWHQSHGGSEVPT